ncbi:hypothetical protein [Cytophaga aurantiaca]|uniref:hypothetical protein n=1 Tax=Cytophaga aurantiaca TaxID=29530 RepID=UPI000371AFBC|nr:hypothetical protein [Cytophaga aurantiaca]
MKNTIIKKLTIIIEATNCISNDVMKAIYDLEKSIAPNQELKLSLVALKENDLLEVIKNKPSESISPEHWDYWAV